MQLHATGDDLPSRYIIEVKRREDLERDTAKHQLRFQIGRICAEETGAVFRIMDESRIRTPYLQNARLLAHHLAIELTDHEWFAVCRLRRAGPMTVADAIAHLGNAGFAEPDARHIIEHAVAHRSVRADLSVPFSDGKGQCDRTREGPAHSRPGQLVFAIVLLDDQLLKNLVVQPHQRRIGDHCREDRHRGCSG